jgi:antitoxin (DNA-binding transcriptional repressor) of toxin-antitoxin stability system
MRTISVQYLQRDVSDFIRRVEAGESFLVVSGQRPLAEVRPVSAPLTEPRPFGLCAGEFAVPPDFDLPLRNEVLQEFKGQ